MNTCCISLGSGNSKSRKYVTEEHECVFQNFSTLNTVKPLICPLICVADNVCMPQFISNKLSLSVCLSVILLFCSWGKWSKGKLANCPRFLRKSVMKQGKGSAWFPYIFPDHCYSFHSTMQIELQQLKKECLYSKICI